MATPAEMAALLAVTCPWCQAAPGHKCQARTSGRTSTLATRLALTLTTLDGGCHDARWQAALGRGAAVIADAVAEARRKPDTDETREVPTSTATATAVLERPW